MKSILEKIIGSSFFAGMASVYCPSVIKVEESHFSKNTDLQNIANDWKQIGLYISKVYESTPKQ